MREGWVYKKLGEVCEIKPNDKLYLSTLSNNCSVSFLPMEDLGIGKKMVEAYKEKLLCEVSGSYTQFMNGDVLLAKVTPCFENGKLGIASNLRNGIGFGSSEFVVFRAKETIVNSFLYYAIQTPVFKKEGCQNFTGTSGLKRLSSAFIKNYIIPLPPLTTQQQIVSELDLLSHILDQKRQQLKEYDALAESIFYDMFGDESKFKKEKLVKLTTKIGSGATPKGGNQAYKDEGISLIRSLNVHNAEFKYEDLAHIDEEQAAALNNVTLEKNDVLFNITGASVTRCCIVPENVLPARVNQHVAILRSCTEVLNYIFLSHLLISSHYHDKLYALSRSNGATREAITKAQLEKFVIPLPPLDLQHSFATKIESIEHQKQLLKESIKETEMLFQSRMDYWFNS